MEKKVHMLMRKMALTMVVVAGFAHAATLSFDYTGTITSELGPPEPGFAGLVVGDKVSGGFSYDPAAVNQGTATLGFYAVQNLFLQVGPFTYTLPNIILQIDLQGGYLWETGNSIAPFSLALKFEDTMAPFVQSDTLLRPPPDAAAVDVHQGSLIFHHAPESNFTHLNFNIDSVTRSSEAPEPSTFAFWLMAGILWFLGRRRWSTSRLG